MFSSYKNPTTYKDLIGISPSGAVTFMSEPFPESIFDMQLTQQGGLLGMFQLGNSIMADEGFDIMEDLAPIGVKLNLPPFLHGKNQLHSRELVESRRIASLKVHVERYMERMYNHQIIEHVLPLTLICFKTGPLQCLRDAPELLMFLSIN